MRFYPFVFTGNDPRKGWRIPLNEIKYNEQRDEETGYGYFGARYMDHELMTMWLSVDPMADKYPSISPYAYCAWNPVKLVDPDSMEVEYSSFGDWLRVSFARLVSKDFNSKYKILKASEETYVFNGVSEKELGEGRGGEFTTDGGKLIINYRLKGKESEGDNCFVNLLHETEHAIQFEYGEVGFINVDGEWLGALKSFDISDEYNAREAGYSWPFYLSSNPNSTRKLWNMQSKEDNIDLLRTSETYAPLKDGPLYNKNTERQKVLAKKTCQTQFESYKVFGIKMCQKEPSPLTLYNPPSIPHGCPLHIS